MKNFESFKLLKNIIKERNYSANNLKQYNTYNTYKCKEHFDYYNKICLTCNIDICSKCEKNLHSTHQIIKYEEIMPDNFEIKNLQNKLKDYMDTFELLRKSIIDWVNEIKTKLNSFEKIYNKNEIKNSYEFTMNYSYKTPLSFDTIYKFRKLYNNLIETNTKNKSLLQKIKNFENDNLPVYISYKEIKSLLQNININKNNQIKKSELILNYLNSIPLLTNTDSDKYNSIYNYKKTESSLSPIEKINSNSICDKSTGNDNYKTITENKNKKEDEFKKILSKTIISDFSIGNSNKKNLNLNRNNTSFTFGKKEYNISKFTKYLNEMGLISTKQDLHKVNSSQDLLSKSIISYKSTKYINTENDNLESNLNKSFVYKRQNNIFKSGTKSAMNSPKANKIFKSNFNIYTHTTQKFDYKNNNWYEHPLLTSKKQKEKKTFIHKKFNLNNIRQNNEICNTEIKKDSNINIDKNIIKSSLFNNNNKQNVNINNKVKNKIYERPLQQELFKYNTINNIKDKNSNYLELKEQNKNKNNLFNLICSPINNHIKDTQQISTINKNKINFNSNPFLLNNNTSHFTILKLKKNSFININPKKDLYLGLDLNDSESKIGIINQDLNEIQLINLSEINNDYYSIPAIISFLENKKEIKIGKEAENEIFNNPSQTINDIVKFFGKKMKEIKYQKELLPYKIYSSNNNEEDKPYIKINHGPQKDKIVYMDNILSIYLQKIFEIFCKKIKIENEQDLNNKTNIKIILVISVPNYFNYYQRKLLEEIFKQEIIPKINNEFNINNNSIRINFVLDKIQIKNSTNLALLNLNIDNIKHNNIFVLHIDKNCSNMSLISLDKEENNKKTFKVKAINSIEKGENDIINDFMLYLLNNRFNEKIKNKILNSPLALVKMRILCNKIKQELLNKEKTKFNLNEILLGHDSINNIISVNKNEYENCLYNYIYDLKLEMKKMLDNKNIINKIIFIGKIFEDEKIKINIEKLLKEKNISYEEIIINDYNDFNNEFSIVGGATYYAMNIKNNKYLFQDISNFNIGIKTYNDTLFYLIKKGDIFPIKLKAQIKIKSNSEIELYEENYITKNKKIIGKFILEDNYIEKKLKYQEIKIEYEINEDLDIKMSIFNGQNFSNVLNSKLYIYNF